MKHVYRNQKFTAVFTDEDGYFSLTGDVDGGSGACGDSIVKIDPRFKLMNDMHLCDVKTGKPMHAWENAGYFWKNQQIAFLRNHLHTTEENLTEYCGAMAGLRDAHKLEKDISGYNARVTQSIGDRLAVVKKTIEEGWLQDVEDVVEQAADLFDEYEEEYAAEYFDWGLCDEPAKVKALSEHLECDPSDITEEDSNRFGAHGREYLVVNDDEADELWDEDLDNYIDECLEIPDSIRNYFDRDAWKRDAKMDGRGHSLSRYDGEEHDVTVEYDEESLTYYIYRQ